MICGDGGPGAYRAALYCAGTFPLWYISNPVVHVTHPHQWLPATPCGVWSFSAECGGTCKVDACYLSTTHNGHFVAWFPYRQTTVDVSTVGLWLDRVLGMMDQTILNVTYNIAVFVNKIAFVRAMLVQVVALVVAAVKVLQPPSPTCILLP